MLSAAAQNPHDRQRKNPPSPEKTSTMLLIYDFHVYIIITHDPSSENHMLQVVEALMDEAAGVFLEPGWSADLIAWY